MHKQQGWPQLRILSSKADSTLGELHKEWTEAGVSASRVHHAQTSSGKGLPSHFWTETTSEASYLGCGEKITQWSKSCFQMKVNFAFHLETRSQSRRKSEEAQNPCCLKSVWSFHSQWWFGLPCHLLVLVHCVFWSPQSTQPSTRKF